MAIADGDDPDLLQVVSDAWAGFLESRNPGTAGAHWEMSRDWWDRCAATVPRDDDEPPPEPAEGDLLYGMPVVVAGDGPPRVVAEQRPCFRLDANGEPVQLGVPVG